MCPKLAIDMVRLQIQIHEIENLVIKYLLLYSMNQITVGDHKRSPYLDNK